MKKRNKLNQLTFAVSLFSLLSSLILGVVFYFKYPIIDLWLLEKASPVIILGIGLILFFKKIKVSHFILTYFGLYFFIRTIFLLKSLEVDIVALISIITLYSITFLFYIFILLKPESRIYIGLTRKAGLLQFGTFILLIVAIITVNYLQFEYDSHLVEYDNSELKLDSLIKSVLDQEYKDYSYSFETTIEQNSSAPKDSIINLRIKINTQDNHEISEVWMIGKNNNNLHLWTRLESKK